MAKFDDTINSTEVKKDDIIKVLCLTLSNEYLRNYPSEYHYMPIEIIEQAIKRIKDGSFLVEDEILNKG